MKQDKLAEILEVNGQMVGEINKSISRGGKYYVNTYLGTLEVGGIDRELWVHCPHANGGFGRSFAIHGGELKQLHETGIC